MNRHFYILAGLLAICTTGFSQILNFPPTAVSDQATTLENTAVTFSLVANDRDINGNLDPSTVDLNTQVVGIQDSVGNDKGAFKVDTFGIVTFTPAPAFFGNVTVKYNVSDSMGATSNDAKITVEVESVNEPPVAVNDAATTNEETNVAVNVVLNDTDNDGTIDTSKVDLDVAAPGIQKNKKTDEGDWSANKGIVTYKPKGKFTGTAKLDYLVHDNENAASNIATITVTVLAVNKPPVAANDTGATTVNKPVTINVVTNDTDADGTIDVATVDLNTGAPGIQNTANTAQGSYAVSALGEVTYTPIANFIGAATLAYTVNDNGGATSGLATITITVRAENKAPVAASDNATTNKNKPVSIKVTDNDTDSDGTIDVTKVDLNITLAGIQNGIETQQGTYSANAAGVVTYTPANNFTGVAALAYTVMDNAGAVSNQALINITVQNVNAAPLAVNDNAATSQNTLVTINVVANDTDSDGVVDAAKVDINTTTAGIQNTNTTPQGVFTVNNIGIVTYTPAKDFTGNATLNYFISDNSGAVSNAATITVAVQPANAPIANEDKASTRMNVAVDINVIANDKDTDGAIDPASVDLNTTTAGIQRTSTTAQGAFTTNPTGIVNFVPRKDFVGTAILKYTVNDNKGIVSNVANITITVDAVPRVAPEITAFEDATDTLRYTPGMSLPITEDLEITDTDSDSLTVAEAGFAGQSYSPGVDKLLFADTQRIKGQFNAVTGLLTLTGKASIAEYETAIRSVKYNYTAPTDFRVSVKRVYVRVSDGNKFSSLRERVIKVNSALKDLDIPTAFTPNGDGANDLWKILAPPDITGSEFANAEVRVYDKRGAVVFDKNNLVDSWDGTFQGKLLPVDTYYYTIVLKQNQKRYKGVVAILR